MADGRLVVVDGCHDGPGALAAYSDMASRHGYERLCVDLSARPVPPSAPQEAAETRARMLSSPPSSDFSVANWSDDDAHLATLRSFLSFVPEDAARYAAVVAIGPLLGRLPSLRSSSELGRFFSADALSDELLWIFHGGIFSSAGRGERGETADWMRKAASRGRHVLILREAGEPPGSPADRASSRDLVVAQGLGFRCVSSMAGFSSFPSVPVAIPASEAIAPCDAARLVELSFGSGEYQTHAGPWASSFAQAPSVGLGDSSALRFVFLCSSGFSESFPSVGAVRPSSFFVQAPASPATTEPEEPFYGESKDDASKSDAWISEASASAEESSSERPVTTTSSVSGSSGRPSSVGRRWGRSVDRPVSDSSDVVSDALETASKGVSARSSSIPPTPWTDAEPLSRASVASLSSSGVRLIPVARKSDVVGVLPGRGAPDNPLLKIRGLMINRHTGAVVARGHSGIPELDPLRGEDVAAVASGMRGPCLAEEKLDGIFGIVGWDPDSESIVHGSSSGPESSRARTFRSLMEERLSPETRLDLAAWMGRSRASLSFEAMDPFSARIVACRKRGLFLFDVWRRSERPARFGRDAVISLGAALGVPTPPRAGGEMGPSEFRALMNDLADGAGAGSEGYVIECSSGLRFSVRTLWWRRWRRLETLRLRSLSDPTAADRHARTTDDSEERAFAEWMADAPRMAMEILLPKGLPVLRALFESGADPSSAAEDESETGF
jgi:hypothetical protein